MNIDDSTYQRFALFMSYLHDRHGIDMNVLYDEAVRTLKPYSREDDLENKRNVYDIRSRLAHEIMMLHTGGME